MTDIKEKLGDDLQDNLELENTLKLEGNEYNINAVIAEVTKRTMADLALEPSTGGRDIEDEYTGTFDGSADRAIKYVPSDGGKFTGPVFIESNLAELDAETLGKAIINYGQITEAVADLNGAPLYTLDAGGQIYASTAVNNTYHKLNTVIGTSQGLEALKRIAANPNGSAGIKYSYDTTSKTYTVEGPDPDAEYFDPNVVIPATYKDPVTSVEATVTTIKEKAFYENLNITSAVLPSSITSIGGINKSTNAPGIQAFYGCKNLVSVNIPDGVQLISSSTFNGCTKLKNLKLGSGIKTIGSSAFSQCDSLESVVIPEKVTKIEGFAFNGCEKLASVVIPKSLTTIGEQIFDVAASTPAVPLKIYYTGTKAQWDTLLANNEKFPSGSAAGQVMPNRRITGGEVNGTKIEPATVEYAYNIPPAGVLTDSTEFIDNPILYICKDTETATIPASNKMFLKLPGSTADFVEVSKGAARLESTTGTSGYYTYETLAAIIAGLNTRLAGIGLDTLRVPDFVSMPSVLPEYIPEDTFDPDDVPTLQSLQADITAIKGGDGSDGDSLTKIREDLDELIYEVCSELDHPGHPNNEAGTIATVATQLTGFDSRLDTLCARLTTAENSIEEFKESLSTDGVTTRQLIITSENEGEEPLVLNYTKLKKLLNFIETFELT